MATAAAPPGYEPVASDRPWDPAFVEIVPPERVELLADWGSEAPGPTALSPVAITSPFRFLTAEAVAILQEICTELGQSAGSDARIAKRTRGGIYRSAFLRGMYEDPRILAFLRELAQAPLEPHPVSHHAVHINYAPDELERNVDQWHRDVVSFDYVLMVNDPRPMKGGRFEYFVGPVEEGRALLEAGDPLPADRVVSPDFPGPGWAVLQQGHRVLHRAGRLEERYPRITLVASYYTPHPEIADPTDLSTLLHTDGREIALVEWSRYKALLAARKLERFADEKTDFARPLDDVRAALAQSIADAEEALAAFESDEAGRIISFGEPSK